MNLKIFIDKEHKQEILIYSHEKTPLISAIEQLVNGSNFELYGYKEKEAVRLNVDEICCFTVCQNKVYALCDNDKFQLKCRLYQIEQNLSQNFVKVNQSCIANIKKIKRFDAHISGSLAVCFKNGYTDYVSRRNLKNVKERLGIK